jgi:hypothetical protein
MVGSHQRNLHSRDTSDVQRTVIRFCTVYPWRSKVNDQNGWGREACNLIFPCCLQLERADSYKAASVMYVM